MWGTVIFGHGKEKHEPKIIDDHKMDNTPQNLIPDEGERLNSCLLYTSDAADDW